jgi:hypothetical protein
LNERIRAWWHYYRSRESVGVPYDPAPDYTALTQADVYTFKTPHYMLSCAQDYRPGKPGFEQHIWQATLPGDAVVFATQPGLLTLGDRPDYWKGNGFLPKAVAHRNVLISLYRIPPDKSKLFCTHAYFPRHAFDRTEERSGWIFGQKEDGYVALYSKQPANWRRPDKAELREVFDDREDVSDRGDFDYIAWNHSNVWICELGSKDTHGSFEEFIGAVSNATVSGNTGHVEYDSPSLGTMSAGWAEPLIVAGHEIQLHGYPRFMNPYCSVEFASQECQISCEDKTLTLDFTTDTREAE